MSLSINSKRAAFQKIEVRSVGSSSRSFHVNSITNGDTASANHGEQQRAGAQTIRLLFDQPRRVRRIHLAVDEPTHARTRGSSCRQRHARL